jgi:pyrroloquinoline quinone biosynthesis protein B
MHKHYGAFLLFIGLLGSAQTPPVKLRVLGTVQDAGAPQLACKKQCCHNLSLVEKDRRKVSSLAVQVSGTNQAYLFDASPDLSHQFATLLENDVEEIAGIFLTHAHMGHYAGLLQLGREAYNSASVPVYAMPRMRTFLQKNAPWEQLLQLQNIILKTLEANQSVALEGGLRVQPIVVPHRDEYSETVAYWIQGPTKSALYLPDIDKWERWKTPIEEWIQRVDYAFLDATFYDGQEIPHRSMEEIPHPFVVESLQRFESLPLSQRQKIYFIHLNHTNPLLQFQSDAYQKVKALGYQIAERGDVFSL